MQSTRELSTLPDDELLHRLVEILRRSRGAEADLVAHVGEVDARRLYLREAAPSMFAYCTERLRLSEPEAYLRIAVARASREHPVLLDMLADGRLHLSAIARLAPHLTPANRERLLERATHMSKREVEELVAELEPRPDAPSTIRKLPQRLVARRASSAELPLDAAVIGAGPSGDGQGVPAAPAPGPGGHLELRPDKVVSGGLDGRVASSGAPEGGVDSGVDASGIDASGIDASGIEPRSPVVDAPRPARIEPLAPARYRVQFTASAALREKLERLRALMRSAVPDGDLAAVIEAAVTEKIDRLEARRFGRARKSRRNTVAAGETGPSQGREMAAVATEPPRARVETRTPTKSSAASSRDVPAEVRRAVYERDGGQCHYVDARGRRCAAREGLEFHHRRPWGYGGEHSLDNVCLLCEPHHRLVTEADYGRRAVARCRRGRQRAFEREPSAR